MVWRRQLKLRLEVHLPKICMALQLFQTESQESVNSSSTDVTVLLLSLEQTIRNFIEIEWNWYVMVALWFWWLWCFIFQGGRRPQSWGELKSRDLVKTWSTFGINVVPQIDLCLLHSVVQPVLLSSPMQRALDKLRFYSCSWWLISQRSCLESLLAMPEERGSCGKEVSERSGKHRREWDIIKLMHMNGCHAYDCWILLIYCWFTSLRHASALCPFITSHRRI